MGASEKHDAAWHGTETETNNQEAAMTEQQIITDDQRHAVLIDLLRTSLDDAARSDTDPGCEAEFAADAARAWFEMPQEHRDELVAYEIANGRARVEPGGWPVRSQPIATTPEWGSRQGDDGPVARRVDADDARQNPAWATGSQVVRRVVSVWSEVR